MPTYRLTYFNARGRAETCRLLFALAGQEYEDVRMKKENWAKEKPGFALGVLPALEVDGKQYGQSIALGAFLARQFGFHGKTNIEILEVDQVIGILGDIFTQLTRAMREPNEARKAEILKENEVNLSRYLGFLEKILKNNKTGFYVGNKLGFADVATFDALDNRVKSDVLGRFPLVQANIQKVRTNDRISKWLAKRPETPM